jgi:hypothetical protein
VEKVKKLTVIFVGLILASCLSACSKDQLKRGTYYSIHEKQRQDCINQGRVDCDHYDYESYDEYQRKRNEQ